LKTAKELFDKLYTRRMLIRLIGVKFSSLVQGSQQLNMFEDTPEMTSLYQAMDRIRLRFGAKSIRRAAGMKDTRKLLVGEPGTAFNLK
jgi:DNA polymerase-4